MVYLYSIDYRHDLLTNSHFHQRLLDTAAGTVTVIEVLITAHLVSSQMWTSALKTQRRKNKLSAQVTD